MQVKLILRVRAAYPGQDPELVKQNMTGDLVRLLDGWQITYIEPDPGMQGIKTALTFKGDSVTMTREGSKTVMQFIPNTVTNCVYALDFGTMDMEIATESLHWAISGNRGKLDMKYSIGAKGDEPGKMTYHLLIQ